MSTDSLIDSIKDSVAKLRAAPVVDLQEAANEILAIIRQHEVDRYNIGIKQVSTIPIEASEILDIEADFRLTVPQILCHWRDCQRSDVPFAHLSKAEKKAYESQAEDVLNYIRPYLRTTEPVSVSLAKCKWEISKVFVPDGIWNIEEGMKMERAAKAVLDVAGVKYVA